jgi:hypothetical protein
MKREKFEYCCHKSCVDNPTSSLEKELNAFGKKGWELVYMKYVDEAVSYDACFHCIFKRKLKEA